MSTGRVRVRVPFGPLVLRSGLEAGFQHSLISCSTPVQIRPPQLTGWASAQQWFIPTAGQVRLLDPALTAEYANSAKRPGREPGDGLWVRVPPRLLMTADCQRSAVKTGRAPVPIVACRRLMARSISGPVVQGRESLAYIQGMMVQLHPGSLKDVGAHVPGGRGCLANSL